MRITINSGKSAKTPVDAPPSFQARCTAALRDALPAELEAHGAALSSADIDAIATSLARQLAKLTGGSNRKEGGKALAAPEDEWISTQEAANRCGFSRPFVAALLDSGCYQGEVRRTPGGHRKVLAGEFETLVAQASATAPRTLAQARQAVDLTRQDDAEVPPRSERKQSRARAQALAKKLGIRA